MLPMPAMRMFTRALLRRERRRSGVRFDAPRPNRGPDHPPQPQRGGHGSRNPARRIRRWRFFRSGRYQKYRTSYAAEANPIAFAKGQPGGIAQAANGPMQLRKLFRRHGFSAFQDLRPRPPPARTSRFSSSLNVSMRSVSISSISVPSKKSPALSGAICG